MSLLSINFDGFSLAKAYQHRLSRLHVVIKKKKSEPAKFILRVKSSCIFLFSAVSGVEIKKIAEIKAAHFQSSGGLAARFHATPRALVLRHGPVRKLSETFIVSVGFQ